MVPILSPGCLWEPPEELYKCLALQGFKSTSGLFWWQPRLRIPRSKRWVKAIWVKTAKCTRRVWGIGPVPLRAGKNICKCIILSIILQVRKRVRVQGVDRDSTMSPRPQSQEMPMCPGPQSQSPGLVQDPFHRSRLRLYLKPSSLFSKMAKRVKISHPNVPSFIQDEAELDWII